MEAIIKFDLNDADDRISHLRCVKALDMAIALWHIGQLHKKLEHIEEVGQLTSDDVMKLIYEIFNDHGISLDEIIN